MNVPLRVSSSHCAYAVIAVLVLITSSAGQSNSEQRLLSNSSAESRPISTYVDAHVVNRRMFRVKDSSYALAYDDVANILLDQNPCSEFFGGPAVLEPFNRLATQITKMYTTEKVSIRMSGPQTTVQNASTLLHYRLFEKAEINGRGLFFNRNMLDNFFVTARFGNFVANTREARALMLLHELGHLIETSPGHWLLPDDGNDDWQSNENTATVLKHCEGAIKARSN